MRVLGIDGSLTATGLAVLETEGVPGTERIVATDVVHTAPEPGLPPSQRADDDAARCDIIAARCVGMAQAQAVDVVGLETPYVGRNVAAAQRLQMLATVIHTRLRDAGFVVYGVAPSSRACALGMRGRGVGRREQKRQIAQAVELRYGLRVGPGGISGDEADAIGVGIVAAQKHLRAQHPAKQLRLELKRAAKRSERA